MRLCVNGHPPDWNKYDQCRQCVRDAGRRYRAKHPGASSVRVNRFREKRPEYVRAYAQRYAMDHADVLHRYQREYYANNREYCLRLSADWIKRHPEVKAKYNHRRRVQGVVGDFWTEIYLAMMIGDPCSYCGRLTGGVDHVVALNQQGEHHWDNLTSSCRWCNASKSDKHLLVWLATRKTKKSL